MIVAMPPSGRRSHDSSCPIALSLDVFGDRWTLIVLRDLIFLGKRRFSEFAASREGIATNVLSDRLRRLEEDEIVVSEPDPEDGRRVLYRLTPKGVDLIPILVELILWGAKHQTSSRGPKAFLERLERDREGMIAVAKQHGIETDGVHPDILANEVFEATVEDHLDHPTFVIDYPASICPLTKRKQDNPDIAERFEMFIHGMELANAYTELNDPRLQEDLFLTQLDGMSEEDSMAKMDHDFVQALKVGMPPAGGLGIGIDRLIMILTDARSIRDVIYFPLLRPEA